METTALDDLRAAIPDYARDLRLNLGSVLAPAGAPGLNPTQIWAIALSCAIAARHHAFTQAIEAAAGAALDEPHRQAARAAAAIMGMNNIYYRFLHLVEDEEYQQLPARLRMNGLVQHGIAAVDFELLCLAVSAVNGCGLCVRSHAQKLRTHGVERETIQSAVRIAAVIHATAVVLETVAADAAPAGAVAAVA